MTAPRALPDDFPHDPLRTYRELRERGPIHHVVLPNGIPGWLVVDHDLARRALADPALSKDAADATALNRRLAAEHGADGAFGADLPRHMLNADPPDHDRLRRLVNRAFTPRSVQRLRPRIEALTGELLDAMEDRGGPVDLLDAFAFPLPIGVICELLGIPESDRGDFRSWTTVVATSTGPDSAEITTAYTAIMDYLAGLVEHRRRHPGDRMVDTLIEAAEDGDRLHGDELLSTLFLLLVAGFETTANLIGNGTLALLRHPEQLALLRADPSLLPGAVEEFLRYDAPLNLATLRHTTAPWTAGGVTVPADQFVLVALLAANDDPARFPEPERLDVTRRAGGHVTFGHGIHFCVGAPLARLEGEIAFGMLLDRFPGLAPARAPEHLARRGSTLMHGLVELPVRLR